MSKEVTIHNQISENHAQLIDHYLTNKCSKVKAYMDLNPDVTYMTASVQFAVIEKRPEVKEYIRLRTNEIKEEANIKAVDIAQELKKHIYEDRTAFAGLTAEELKQLPPNQKALIQDVTTKTREYKRGKETVKETTIQVKLVPKLDAIKELNKMTGNYGEHNKQKATKIDISKLSINVLNEVLQLTKEDNNTIDIGQE